MKLKNYLLIFPFLSLLLISAIILSAGCLQEDKVIENINNTQNYKKVEPDCPEGEYLSSSAADECRLWMDEGSWIPVIIFDSEISDSTITSIMDEYFGDYDTEWRIYNFSANFPQYLDSPKDKYNYYTDLLKEKWGFTLNCYSNCSILQVIAFEKEKGDNVILGLSNCPIKYKNCFEEMKKAGIPVKKTKSASPLHYTTDNSNEDIFKLLKEINKDENVLFVTRSYLR